MRGSRRKVIHVKYVFGIIPAYAGLTEAREIEGIAVWDHPRVCGAHTLLFSDIPSRPGSSPRMRGSLDDGYKAGRASGIIPAYAGLTQRLA